MTDDKRNALLGCLHGLADAMYALDDCDDCEDEFVCSVHWAIKDIQSDIEKVLS